MASENVKIKIQEHDITTPLGAGTSSDIVYVPGFSTKFNAIKNIPVLCNNVDEFEKAFGTLPKTLTELDVVDYAEYGYLAGDPDRSYIYAKELLTKGMSVIYANIDNRTAKTKEILSPVVTEKTETPRLTVTNGTDGITFETSGESVQDAFTVTGAVKVNIAAGDNGQAVRTFIEFAPEITDDSSTLVVSSFAVDDVKSLKEKLGKGSTIVPVDTSSNVVGFENTGDALEDFEVGFSLTIVPNNFGAGVAKATATLSIKEFTSSLIKSFYDKYKDVLEFLEDKNEYSVKYITSGGYPAVVGGASNPNGNDILGQIMINLAAKRGDAVALVDYMMTAEEELYSIGENSNGVYDSIYSKMQRLFASAADGSYGAAMYPWGIYNCSNTLIEYNPDKLLELMPASFGYMMCVATAIKTSPNWLAMAGVARGVVPNLQSLYTSKTLTNVIAEEYQPKFGTEDHTISINAITNIRPYGLTLWGNRTLMPVDPKGTKALNFLNTRNMVSDIKKVLYTTAKSLMFEQDSDTLWLRFKSGVSPLLNQLVSGNGISDYKIIRTKTKYNGDPLTRGEMAATIKIYPLYAIEYFELTVQISDQDVTVE